MVLLLHKLPFMTDEQHQEICKLRHFKKNQHIYESLLLNEWNIDLVDGELDEDEVAKTKKEFKKEMKTIAKIF